MDYFQLINNVKTHTGMYLPGETYAEAAAFMIGCDAGNNFGLLAGFREWLIVRIDGFNNMHWSGIVLHFALPGEGATSEDILLSKEKNRKAIDTMCELLVEFLREREAHDGLLGIFDRYLKWLHRQAWHVPLEDSDQGNAHKRPFRSVIDSDIKRRTRRAVSKKR